MKKLIVVTILAFSLVFSAAMIASAAPTVSGELDFGKDFQDQAHGNVGHNIGFAEIKADTNITDNITAHIGFKADPILGTSSSDYTGNTPFSVYTDEAWFKMAGDMGTFKVGKFAYNQKSGIDILKPAIDDLGTELTASYAVNVADGLTINAAAANDDNTTNPGLVYSVGLAYVNDMFGGDVNYSKPVVGNDKTTIGANGWYKLGDFKLFGNYENNSQSTATDSVVGVSYDSTAMPLYGRVEFDLQTTNSTNPYGVRLGYKVNNNMKIQYQIAKNQRTGSDDDQYLKAIVTF